MMLSMTTTQKTSQIAQNFVELRDKGHSVNDAISIIAKASNTDSNTILVAIHYALAG